MRRLNLTAWFASPGPAGADDGSADGPSTTPLADPATVSGSSARVPALQRPPRPTTAGSAPTGAMMTVHVLPAPWFGEPAAPAGDPTVVVPPTGPARLPATVAPSPGKPPPVATVPPASPPALRPQAAAPTVPPAPGATPPQAAHPAAHKPAAPAADQARLGAPPADRLPVGAILDKYRIEEVLGSGSFGTVYRAVHLLLGTTVSLKVFRRRSGGEGPSLEQVSREGRSAAAPRHPAIVAVTDVTHERRLSWIVMEHVPGGSLAGRIKKYGPLPAAWVARIGEDLASALGAALRSGWLHRDIKPANVLLTWLPGSEPQADDRGPAAKLADFGLAAPSVPAGDGTDRRPVGTPRYMAPELLTHPADADHRADVFGLGVTLLEALTGRLPEAPAGVHPDDYSAAARAAGTGSPKAPPPAEPPRLRADRLVASVPGLGRLSDLLRQMLAGDPAARPSDYTDLAAKFRAARRGSSEG